MATEDIDLTKTMHHGWLKQAEYLSTSPEKSGELFDKLLHYWSSIGTLSGLMAGFTFNVLTNDSDLLTKYSKWSVFRWHELDFFALFLSISFYASLAATLMASLLYSHVNYVGKQRVAWFIQQFEKTIQKPQELFFLGVFCLLFSCVFAVAETKNLVILTTAILLSFASFFGLLRLHVKIVRRTRKQVADMFEKHNTERSNLANVQTMLSASVSREKAENF